MKNTTLILIALVIVGLLFFGGSVMKKQGISQTQNSTEKKATLAKIPCREKAVPELTEGPYYTKNSPEMPILFEEGIPGEKFILTGYVLDTSCTPIVGAWIDFWQANGEGIYDNSGYTLRGHQYTDTNGKYRLETVIPGEYPGRTPHIHVKVQATKASPIVTTQLYIPGIDLNATDKIFDESLLMTVDQEKNTATYNFVINK